MTYIINRAFCPWAYLGEESLALIWLMEYNSNMMNCLPVRQDSERIVPEASSYASVSAYELRPQGFSCKNEHGKISLFKFTHGDACVNSYPKPEECRAGSAEFKKLVPIMQLCIPKGVIQWKVEQLRFMHP